MKWWPWQREAPKTIVRSKSVIGENDVMAAMLPLLRSSGLKTPAESLALYEDSTAVSIPIDWVADPLADIDPVLETRDGKFDNTHPVLELLQSPSPDYTGRLFRDVISHDYLITGETFVAALGPDGRPPVELQPLSPSAMNAWTEDGTGIVMRWEVTGPTLKGNYTRTRERQQARYINEKQPMGAELRQIRRYSTTNHSLVRAQSPLVSASREARQHLLGLLHNSSLLTRGGRGSLVFNYKQEGGMIQDDLDELMARIRSQYGGAGNAGKIMIEVAEALEILELGASNKDMDFATLQSMAQRAIALRYHVPLPLITTDASTFANFEASILALYDYAVLPAYRRIFDGLSDFLLPRFNLDPRNVRLSYDPNQITALMSRRLDELVKRRGLYVESGNELRAALGREPAGPEFDTILVPANLLPAGSDLFTGDNLATVNL